MSYKLCNVLIILDALIGTISFIIYYVLLYYTGHRKLFDLEAKTRGPKTVALWHADAGLLLWDLLCITIITGAILFLHMLGMYYFLVTLFYYHH